jgi:hypothetical protein
MTDLRKWVDPLGISRPRRGVAPNLAAAPPAAMLPLRQASPGDEPLDTRSIPCGCRSANAAWMSATREPIDAAAPPLPWIPSALGSRPVPGVCGRRLSERLGRYGRLQAHRQRSWRASTTLETALMATRREDLQLGTDADYVHGCACRECREHQRICMAATANTRLWRRRVQGS